MNKTRLEMIVGFFVLLALVIFFVIVFFVSGVYFLREGIHVKAKFDYVAGLEKGASVRLAGVRVGEVNSVQVTYDKETQKPLAIVDMWLEKGADIREKSKVYILGTFALSECHIAIVSEGDTDGRLLVDGDIIRGISPLPIETLIDQGREIADGVQDMMNKVNAILGDEDMQEMLRQMIIDMCNLLSYMDRIVSARGDSIEQSVGDMETIIADLKRIVDTIDKGEGTVGQLIKNDELYLEMKDFIREIKLHPWRLLKKDKK